MPHMNDDQIQPIARLAQKIGDDMDRHGKEVSKASDDMDRLSDNYNSIVRTTFNTGLGIWLKKYHLLASQVKGFGEDVQQAVDDWRSDDEVQADTFNNYGDVSPNAPTPSQQTEATSH